MNRNEFVNFVSAVKLSEQKLTEQVGARDVLQQVLNSSIKELETVNSQLIVKMKTVELFKSMSDEVSGKLFQDLQKLVTKGLRVVFGGNNTFVIESDVKADLVYLSFWIDVTVGDKVYRVPLKGFKGGGMISMVAFILQIVYVYMMRNVMRAMLVLDEPLSELSPEYRAKASEFVAYLAENLGVQILMVSHTPEFAEAADVVYRFDLKGDVTVVKRER